MVRFRTIFTARVKFFIEIRVESFTASDESNFHLVIINDDLERAYTQLRDFIYEKYKNILSSKNE